MKTAEKQPKYDPKRQPWLQVNFVDSFDVLLQGTLLRGSITTRITDMVSYLVMPISNMSFQMPFVICCIWTPFTFKPFVSYVVN